LRRARRAPVSHRLLSFAVPRLRRFNDLRWLIAFAGTLTAAGRACAQCASSPWSASDTSGLLMIGGLVDERIRLSNDLGLCPMSLIRSPSASGQASSERVTVTPLAGTLVFAWNSKIPVGENDGALWAGRGLSGLVVGGGRVSYRGFTLVLAPVVTWSEN